MLFRLEIETGNAAFGEDTGAEIERILSDLAVQIGEDLNPSRGARGTLRDINGNTVGTWRYTPDE